MLPIATHVFPQTRLKRVDNPTRDGGRCTGGDEQANDTSHSAAFFTLWVGILWTKMLDSRVRVRYTDFIKQRKGEVDVGWRCCVNNN